MRGRRLIFISMLAIFLVIGISLGSASALDFVDFEDTWYKTKFKIKGVCEEGDSSVLFKEPFNDKAWIYIEEYLDSFTAFLITQDEDGEWQETPFVLLTTLTTSEPEVGTSGDEVLDAVLELEDPITITDASTGDVVDILSFFVRLTGKLNRNDELKRSTKLRSVAGAATLDVMDDGDDGYCIASLDFFGGLKRAEKVPQEVFETHFPPES